MKAPISWIKEYAPLSATEKEFADAMTMSGTKVEGWETEAAQMDKVVMGHILAIDPHPHADKLKVLTVDVGQSKPVTILTAAQNLKTGDRVPTALAGATLPGGRKIEATDMRGLTSNGMVLSLAELGLTKHDYPAAVEDGIFVYTEGEPKPGTAAAEALGMDDAVFEFEITANRPDCLGVRGVGREAAATFGIPFNPLLPQPVQRTTGNINDYLSVRIEDAALCQRYTAGMVVNARVKPSPEWMRRRLRQCGVRPINNIVDITNYVMLEYGHPMHAFDHRFVKAKTIVPRLAKEGEQIVTLDGVTRPLQPDMLVIADGEGPMAVAGVMGGEHSGIYEDTDAIVFEAACFYGPSIRRTARRLGMRTEASGRFEKGLDPNTTMLLIARALQLVEQLDAGDVVGGIIDVYPTLREAQRIPLEAGRINQLLGTDLPKEEMVRILRALDFGVEGDTVVVPTWRYDVSGTHDLEEEVARIYGYNRLPSSVMEGVAGARPTPRQSFDKKIIHRLVGYGFYECITYSFYSPKHFDLMRLPEDSFLRNTVRIQNPLGEDTSVMRTFGMPSMIEVVARNLNAKNDKGALFENAMVYFPKGGADQLPSEQRRLVMAQWGEGYDFYTLKGVVEQLLDTAGITEFSLHPNTEGSCYHPGRAADIFQGERFLAHVGEVHPEVLQNYGIKPRVYMAVIDMENLFALRGATPQYQPLPRHPAMERDLALVTDLALPAGEVEAHIREAAGPLLVGLQLFDVYTGERMPTGKKSLAYTLTFRSPDATLTDGEADALVQKVLARLSAYGIELRR